MNTMTDDTIAYVANRIAVAANAGSGKIDSTLLDSLWNPIFKGQIVYPLAFLYMTPHPANPWHGNQDVLDTADQAGRRLFNAIRSRDEAQWARRTGYPLCRAYALLRHNLPSSSLWENNLFRIMQDVFLPVVRECERLTVFSSANCGYGTNHLAVELSALCAYVALFRDKPARLALDPDIPDLAAYARSYLDRFVQSMDEGGYWAECDGPANAYNVLTAQSLFLAALSLGELDRYRPAFESAARFHTRFLFPNLHSAGVTDGRNFQKPVTGRLSFCGLIPEGKTLLTKLARRRLESPGKTSGENLAAVLGDIEADPCFPSGETPTVWEKETFDYAIGDKFAVVKRGHWMAAVSNLVFRPRPEGHWNLDYQNLLSLYHRAFGTILFGHNGKNDPPMATFNKAFDMFDGKPLPQPMWKHIPGKGKLALAPDVVSLSRDYRGFEGRLDLNIIDDDRADLRIAVNARRSAYPVACTLLPACGYRRNFFDAAGKEHVLTESPCRLTGKKLGGFIDLVPETCPDAFGTQTRPRPVRLVIPPESELVWPYKGWDPYNLESDRQQDPQHWRALLHLPIFENGACLEIRLLP
jgi:hypothetical protein